MNKPLGKYKLAKTLFHRENFKLDSFAGEFYQIFMEKIISILYKFFQKIKNRGNIFLTHSFQFSIIVIMTKRLKQKKITGQ